MLTRSQKSTDSEERQSPRRKHLITSEETTKNEKKESTKRKRLLKADDSEKLEKIDDMNDNSDKIENEIKQTLDENHPIVQFKYDLKTVLTHSNHNIEKWLNLEYLPSCLIHFDKCIKKHGSKKNYMKHNHEINYMLQFYLNTKVYLGACKYLQFFITEKHKIPSEYIIAEFFKLILDISDIEDDSSFCQCISEIIEDCIVSLFVLHPPHINYMRQYYKNLFTMPISNCVHKDHENYESFNGYFFYCINRLESELLNINKRNLDSLNGETDHGILNESLQLSLNLNQNDIGCYDDLSQKEKISRLIRMLRIMVTCFEDDLAFRLLVFNKEKKQSHKLLISHVIWGRENMSNVGFMKPCIRKIIRILILSVRSRQRKAHCSVIVRLLGVIAHAIHLISESRKNIFLQINMQINFLAIEISSVIQAEDASTVISILTMLQPCFLKNLVSNNILSTVHNISMNTSSYVNSLYFDIFKKKLWMHFSDEHCVNTNDNSLELDCNAQIDSLQLSSSDYIHILYEAFYSFIDMYDLKNINMKNVDSISKLLENEKLKDIISEDYQAFEQGLFKTNYQTRIENSKQKLINDVSLCGSKLDFDSVMKANKLMHINNLIKQFSYLPAISWITGRSYYKKCVLYRNVVNQIHKLKSEENNCFQKFIV